MKYLCLLICFLCFTLSAAYQYNVKGNQGWITFDSETILSWLCSPCRLVINFLETLIFHTDVLLLCCLKHKKHNKIPCYKYNNKIIKKEEQK